jgi:hypothetical protein
MGYNALVIAPRLEEIAVKNYKRVLVLDSEADISAFSVQVQIGRGEMIKCYNALKLMCGAYDSRARFYDQLKLNPRGERWKIDFALSVFESSVFIEINDTEGFHLRLMASAKRELTESTIFIYIHEAKRWYNDILHD